MSEASLQEELLRQMDQLSPPMQRRVLDYARALVESTPRGTPGNELLEFAGIMSSEEAHEMMRAIEEGCERIDTNEW